MTVAIVTVAITVGIVGVLYLGRMGLLALITQDNQHEGH